MGLIGGLLGDIFGGGGSNGGVDQTTGSVPDNSQNLANLQNSDSQSLQQQQAEDNEDLAFQQASKEEQDRAQNDKSAIQAII